MPVITYPGVTGVIQADVITSVGITPAVIDLVVYPDSVPLTTGTLVIGDGVNPPLTFPDCFCSAPQQSLAKAAAAMTLQIQDRRWRWKYGTPAVGHWNQEAGSGKLVPWSVRSPFQLASLLLSQMGELVDPADQIDLPPGLAHPDFPKAVGDRYVSAGGQYLGMNQNYGLTSFNPETKWVYRPAAQCLADLAEFHGRMVVLDPIDNRVRLRRAGVGAAIPAGFRIRNGTVTQRDAIPTTVIARGSATDYQLRVRLRAVAREWDGSWRPVNDVSYAPRTFGQKMRCLVYGSLFGAGVFDPAAVYAVTLNGVLFATVPPADASFAAVAADLAAKINASALVNTVVVATVSGSALQIDARKEGYEFELTVDGTAVPPPLPNTWSWTEACVRGPMRGTYDRQNAWLVAWPDAQPAGTVLDLTVTAGATVTALQSVVTGDLNGLADATDKLAAQVVGPGLKATAVGGGRSVVVTGTDKGVANAVTVAAGSTGGAAPTVTEVATPVAPASGWERCPAPPFGVSARVPDDPAEFGYGQYGQPEARRLADESVHTCFQVVLENPADGTVKAIPVPELGNLLNQFLLLLQPDSPEPVTPEPGIAEVIDARTLQPFAAATYNGYAVRRPNRVYGSVCRHILARDGLLWRGGTYLTHNTPPRSRLPLTFSVVDPEMQVVRFSQPLYRWLGTGAGSVNGALVQALYPTGFTTQPAELVAEVGAACLDPTTLSPATFAVSVAVPGGFGPALTRVFPDVRRAVLGTYDSRHNLTGFTVLDQDAETRATAYATALADVFQSPAGESVEYDGLVPVSLSGLVRQIRWSVRKDAPGLTTSVDTNSETSRVVPSYPARRRAEGLTPDQLRRQQNLDSDILSRTRQRNALGAAAGGLPFGGR